MKKSVHWLAFLFLTFCLATVVSAQDYTEGKEYLRLAHPQPTADPSRVEVVELFWYGCPHCYHLEPSINKWLESKPADVDFVRLPAIVGARWEPLAQAYFTAEVLGVLDKTHAALFKAIHEKKQQINSEEQIRDFFVSQGIPETDFNNAFHSFAVSVKMNNARLMTRRYAITGVPTLIVNGTFSTSGSLAGSNEGMLAVVDYLVAKERKAGARKAEAVTGE